MKVQILKRRLRFLFTAVILLIFTSCIGENEIDITPSNGESMVTFSIQVPGKGAPGGGSGLRALSDTDENDIQTMDILVFEPNGGDYVYMARCNGAITTDGANPRKKTFTVTLRQGTFDLVLLANARTELSGLSFTGEDKATALSTVISSVSGKWPADGTRPFPMWGEAGSVQIDDATDLSGNDAVKMTRMVARVDVLVTGDPQNPGDAQNTFRLSSVHVYNFNTKGSIAPGAGQWDDQTDPSAPKATAPNVPNTSTLTRGPLLYDGQEVTAAGCTREIYLLEAENHTGTGHTTPKGLLDRTCLVVGGVYDANGNGDFTDDGGPSYYRVDFSTGSGVSQSYLDVLRNHQYIFSITKVSGAGYETANIAFASAPVNIEADVLPWNDAAMTDIAFDGQYYLAVSQGSFQFTREARGGTDTDNRLKISTDVPTGWTAEVWNNLAGDVAVVLDGTTGDPWLRISPASGDGNANEMTLTLDANTSGVERTAYIHIKAGRLKYIVKVTQAIVAMNIITVSPSSVTLLSVANSWSEGIEVECSNGYLVWTASIGNTIDFELVNALGTPITGTQTGNETIYVKAKTENTSTTTVRTTTVTISSTDTDVDITGSPVAVTQRKTLPAGGEPPTNITSYVGAFWKADQTGERIIRIPVGTDAANLGAWSATVYWMDDNWDPGDIVFSTDPTTDPNVSFTTAKTAADMNNATNDALYSVAGNSTHISGTVAANGIIYFRIGLKSKFSDLPAYSATPDGVTTFPARYAIVALSYNDNSKVQLLYLRQGHDPDVLGGPTIAQGNCVKWSPYNVSLTVGQFVAYPTMAGGMKNWDTSTTMFSPVANMGNRSYTGTSIANVCPSTYSIPTCNATYLSTDLSNASWNEGNQMGTLFHGTNIESASGSNMSNPLWGYYADGYFDRHWIRNSNTGTVGAAVNPTSTSVAYIGALVVHGNRSLFFPAAGYIERYYLNQREQGIFAQMWTSLGGDAYLGPWSVTLQKTMNAANIDYVRATAWGETPYASWPTTIRCVKP